MTELTSYSLDLKETPATKQITEIHQVAMNGESEIYVYRENAIANAANLTKLLSFFFLAKDDSSIVMIIDGANTDATSKKLDQILDQSLKAKKLRAAHKLFGDAAVVV